MLKSALLPDTPLVGIGWFNRLGLIVQYIARLLNFGYYLLLLFQVLFTFIS